MIGNAWAGVTKKSLLVAGNTCARFQAVSYHWLATIVQWPQAWYPLHASANRATGSDITERRRRLAARRCNLPPAFNRPDRSGRRAAQAEQMLLAADIDSARLERGAGHALLTQLGFAQPLAFRLRRLDDVHLAGFVE